MAAFARKDLVPHNEVGLFHCCSRCVRRSFLYGKDPLSGKDLSHRRDWVRQRLENLAACFAVEVAGEAVMQNHLHVILRTRPDLAAQWSDEEVARRWLRLSSQRIELRDVDQQRLEATLADAQKIAEYRGRLILIWTSIWNCWIGLGVRFAPTSGAPFPATWRRSLSVCSSGNRV